MTALAREAGYDVNWTRVNGWVNDRASEAARAGDKRPMETMFARIVTLAADRPPATVRLPGAVQPALHKREWGRGLNPPASRSDLIR